MDFLKAEIERKKRQMQEKGVMAGPNKKYFKRGDLAEKQREEYIAKHAPNIEELKKYQDAKNESKSKSKSMFMWKSAHYFRPLFDQYFINVSAQLCIFFIS